MKKNIVLAMCLCSAYLFAQEGLKRDPRELVGVPGQTTITDKVRALHLRYPEKGLDIGFRLCHEKR